MPVDDTETKLLVEIAVEPKSQAEQQRLVAALERMTAADPSFAVISDLESGQLRLRGRDEFHLDRIVDDLLETHGVAMNIGAPQVAYRETLGRVAEIDHTFRRLTAVTGQFARVKIRFEPGQGGTGFVFEASMTDGSVPSEFVPAVLKGVEIARENGLVAGFPVVDFKAILQGGAYHDLDSSAAAFEIAARRAFLELREKGAPVLLEPVMRVEVMMPDAFMGDVVADLNSRRGQIQGTEDAGDRLLLIALVPLANMLFYAETLRAFTDGRAAFSMDFDHYAPTPMGNGWDDDPTFRPAMGMRA